MIVSLVVLLLTLPLALLRLAPRCPDARRPGKGFGAHQADTGHPNERFVAPYVATNNETVVIDDVYSETRFDLTGTKRFSEESGYRTVSMLTVPLSPRDGEVHRRPAAHERAGPGRPAR